MVQTQVEVSKTGSTSSLASVESTASTTYPNNTTLVLKPTTTAAAAAVQGGGNKKSHAHTHQSRHQEKTDSTSSLSTVSSASSLASAVSTSTAASSSTTTSSSSTASSTSSIGRALQSIERIGDYMVGKTIGQGGYGKVKVGTHVTSGLKVALKFINPTMLKPRDRRLVEREIRLTRQLNHPNVVKLLDVLRCDEWICMVLEYVEGKDLYDYVWNGTRVRLSEDEARPLVLQMLDAVQHCHSRMIVHRDIKPENFVVEARTGRVVLIDFGLGNRMQVGGFLKTSCGSSFYASPQVWANENYIGPEVDSWAIGVLLYTILAGHLPWAGRTENIQLWNAQQGLYQTPRNVSECCFDMLQRLLDRNAATRISIPELYAHPWLRPAIDASPSRSITLADVEYVRDTMLAYGYAPDRLQACIANMDRLTGEWMTYQALLNNARRTAAPAAAAAAPALSTTTPQATTTTTSPAATSSSNDPSVSRRRLTLRGLFAGKNSSSSSMQITLN